MSEENAQVEEWAQELLAAYELDDVSVDVNAVLGLAGRAAHTIVRPSAPVTTYIAGLAAGYAAGSGQADPALAQRAAQALARSLIAARTQQEESELPTQEASTPKASAASEADH